MEVYVASYITEVHTVSYATEISGDVLGVFSDFEAAKDAVVDNIRNFMEHFNWSGSYLESTNFARDSWSFWIDNNTATCWYIYKRKVR